jgi:signal peptidase II
VKKQIFLFAVSFLMIIAIDQFIKFIFIDGFKWNGDWLSLILVYNKGVAFSMFSFLGEGLKYLQIALLFVVFWIFFREKILFSHPIISGILLGAGVSNIVDRFIHSGVVDYVYYHGLFNFAVFNFADVMIDFSVAMFVWFYVVKQNKKSKK